MYGVVAHVVITRLDIGLPFHWKNFSVCFAFNYAEFEITPLDLDGKRELPNPMWLANELSEIQNGLACAMPYKFRQHLYIAKSYGMSR